MLAVAVLWLATASAADPETFPLPPKPALAALPWVVERDEGTGWAGYTPESGKWVAYPGLFDRKNPWNHFRNTSFVRAAATFTHDLTAQPWLEIEVPRTTMAWRLTGTIGNGPEILLGDAQLAGSLRVNLATASGLQGPQPITLHIWSTAYRREIDFGARFLTSAQPSQADVALGDIATEHGKALTGAIGMTAKVATWPRLWWNKGNRAAWQQRVTSGKVSLGDLPEMMKDRTPFVVDATVGEDRLPGHGLAFRPVPAPKLVSGEGRYPPYIGLMRPLNWAGFNQWQLAAMMHDDPEIIAQARRWTVDFAAWRFWAVPEWIAYDDGAGYPLQALAQGYDLARESMTPEERAQVRTAIHAVATELYWNIAAGAGYISNDLRSNHAASTLTGLGMAGLVLLGEDPDASLWVSLAELRMVEAFRIHESGASWESPAYGRFEVDELFRLATVLANVTGREHRNDVFFKKHADYQVDIADWDGADLAYNGGGPHQPWNQWVLGGIAAFTRDPEHQWIGDPVGTGEGNGYGERPFFFDPTVPRQRPKRRDVGTYFADIGLATWRTGWEKDDTIVLFYDGPRGPTHQDRGAGHLTLYGRGHRFLADGLGPMSQQHNLVTWDNVSQDQYVGGTMSRFYQDPRAGAATGDHYGWRRVVLYLRPDIVVLVDRLDVFHQNPDRVGLTTFHVAGKVALENGTFTAVEGDTALQGTLVLDTDVTPNGQMGNGPQGTQTIAWRYGSSGESRLHGITLLSLSGAKEAGKVDVVRSGNTWTFRTTTAEVRVGLGKAPVIDGVTADGDVWAARTDKAGPRTAVVCGGAHTLTGGKDVRSNADCAAATLGAP